MVKLIYFMRPALYQLKSHIQDNTVFIVGGGSSLKNFDFNRLKGRKVIGINQAANYIKDLTAIYWVDEIWAAQNYHILETHDCKLRFCGRYGVSDFCIMNDIRSVADSCPLRITGAYGFDPDINNVRGNNSGAHCINLCVNLGAKRIVLLGLDMVPSHWHDDYNLHYDDSIYDQFLSSIESMARELPKGIEVLNCSMISRITCFKKVPFDAL